MSMDLQPGVTVPIPCRSCGQTCMPLKIDSEGRHPLQCPRCGGITIAIVSRTEGAPMTIHTEAKVAASPAPVAAGGA